jgi:type VI secretion system Hcp family effector
LPVKIIKAWGAASPQGLSACATNENLPEVRIEFVKATTPGVDEVYQSISLTDASFSEVRRFTSGDIAQPANTAEVEEWSFTFRKIEVEDNDGRTDFTDNWS